MKTFRGPIQRYPGMPSDSSEDEDADIDYYIQGPVFQIEDVDEDDNDSDDTGGEEDRFVNLVFNPVDDDDIIEVGLSDLEEDDDDEEEEVEEEEANDFDTVFSFNEDGEPDRIIINSNSASNSVNISVSDVEMSGHNRLTLSSPHLDDVDVEETVDISPPSSPILSSLVVTDSDNGTSSARFSPVESDGSANNNNNHHHHIEQFSQQQQPEPTEQLPENNFNSSSNSNMKYPEIEILRKPNTPPPESTDSSSPIESELTTEIQPHPVDVDDDEINKNVKDQEEEDKSDKEQSAPSTPTSTTNTPSTNLLNCDYSDSSCENTPRRGGTSGRREEDETPNIRRNLQDDTQESMEDEDGEEEFCNPMVSQLDTNEDNDDALRGDRIGSTTYCERHVLKILMSWVTALPKLASTDESDTLDKGMNEDEESETVIPLADRPLNAEFEESMSLLWDMTTETDVMDYLIEKDIFGLIRDTVDTFNCPTRLKEIGLGILANILSCSSILEEFPEKDDDLHLVERVVMEVVNSTKVPVLTQAFAVLRRVSCYIRNAKQVERWMKLLLHEEFVNAANFLLASSTNVLLLGDVIMTLFTLMEVLSPPHEEEEKSTMSDEEKSLIDSTMTNNFLPICQSNFVPSICEGLNELLKDSRTNADSFITTAQQEPGNIPACPTTGNGPDVYNNEGDGVVVPPGHIQTAILNGLASLCYLQKFEAGRSLLRQHSKPLLDVLVGIFKKFKACTEIVGPMDTLDYFSLAVDIMGYVHKNLDTLQSSAIIIPAKAALLLLEDEKTSKTDSVVTIGREDHKMEIKCSQVSPYAIVFYDYLINLEEKFSEHTIKTLLTSDCEELTRFYSIVKQVAEKVQEHSSAKGSMSNDSVIIGEESTGSPRKFIHM